MDVSLDGGVLQREYARVGDVTSVAASGPVALEARPFAVFLAGITVLLVVLSLVTHATGVADQIFGLDFERNVPTFFSVIILFIAAALLAVIAAAKRRLGDRYRRQWAGLSVIFLFMSADELIGFHEMMGPRIERFVHTGGLLYYKSELFTGSLVILVALLYLRFLLHLPRRTAVLFFIAAVVYVGGALGMEMIGGLIDQSYGTSNIDYTISSTVEESMEMFGTVLFIYALMTYLATQLPGTSLRVTGEEAV